MPTPVSSLSFVAAAEVGVGRKRGAQSAPHSAHGDLLAAADDRRLVGQRDQRSVAGSKRCWASALSARRRRRRRVPVAAVRWTGTKP